MSRYDDIIAILEAHTVDGVARNVGYTLLADRLGVSRKHISELVNLLCTEGVIDRIRMPCGTRPGVYRITGKARPAKVPRNVTSRPGKAPYVSTAIKPKPDELAARLAEIPDDTRTITGRICGDPVPGRSALDRRLP